MINNIFIKKEPRIVQSNEESDERKSNSNEGSIVEHNL